MKTVPTPVKLPPAPPLGSIERFAPVGFLVCVVFAIGVALRWW